LTESGPAFPVAEGYFRSKGMTLRQWYVGQAMQGLAYGILLLEARNGIQGVSADTKGIVAEAFKLADEALAFEANEKK